MALLTDVIIPVMIDGVAYEMRIKQVSPRGQTQPCDGGARFNTFEIEATLYQWEVKRPWRN